MRSRLLKKIARCARHVGACGVEGLSFDRRRRAADVPAVQLGRATLFRAVANEVFHSTPPPVRVCVVSGLRQVRARARAMRPRGVPPAVRRPTPRRRPCG